MFRFKSTMPICCVFSALTVFNLDPHRLQLFLIIKNNIYFHKKNEEDNKSGILNAALLSAVMG